MIVEKFTQLFKRKKEDSMQERAEESRKAKELEDQFNETQHNLEVLIDEITSKKNHG